jgi:hypothetical protein
MYFIKYQLLKDKLKQRELSDGEALPYLIASSVLTALAVGFPFVENYNEIDTIGGFISLFLAVWGVLYAYKKNGKENGNDLIQKYVVIGWIVFIRCTLAFIPICVALMIVGDLAGFSSISTDETTWFDLVIFTAFEAFLYQRIGRHIIDTRKELS